MALITEKKELVLTKAEADAFIRNASGKVAFNVRVSAVLPVGDDGQAFEGSTFISISRAQARKIVKDMLRNLEERGARVRLHLTPPDARWMDGYAHISIY